MLVICHTSAGCLIFPVFSSKISSSSGVPSAPMSIISDVSLPNTGIKNEDVGSSSSSVVFFLLQDSLRR